MTSHKLKVQRFCLQRRFDIEPQPFIKFTRSKANDDNNNNTSEEQFEPVSWKTVLKIEI